MSGASLQIKRSGQGSYRTMRDVLTKQEISKRQEVVDSRDHNLVLSQKTGTRRGLEGWERITRKARSQASLWRDRPLWVPGWRLDGRMLTPALSQHPIWNCGLAKNQGEERLPDYEDGLFPSWEWAKWRSSEYAVAHILSSPSVTYCMTCFKDLDSTLCSGLLSFFLERWSWRSF